MNQALQRALDQLAQAGAEGMGQEALEGLAESLQLAQAEADALAQAIRDLQELEDALTAAQGAKAANAQGQAGGEGAQTLEEYKEMLRELAQAQGQGDGQGEGDGQGGPGGGRGQGEGGIMEEAPETDSAFKTEKSQSQLVAGRILMRWNTQELGARGVDRSEYREGLKAVEQGLSEAMLAEEVPAGYQDGIKAYFDDLVRRGADD
jgi:hypothetical protein